MLRVHPPPRLPSQVHLSMIVDYHPRAPAAPTVVVRLAAQRAQKRGSGLRWVSEVIQLIQVRQSDVRKIVPCQPRAQPIIRLFWSRNEGVITLKLVNSRYHKPPLRGGKLR